MRLLLVEDHPELAEWLGKALSQAGYVMEALSRGDHADHALHSGAYDLVILDLSLPRLDGLEVLRRLRARGSLTPVLILSARSATEERVQGLNLGADDYLPKPFDLAELEARIKALLRRSGRLLPQARIGKLVFDLTSRLVSVDGQPLALTPRELALLEVLLQRIGRPVSREALFEKIFAFDTDTRAEAIEIHVHRLRKKLEGTGAVVNTMRGLLYGRYGELPGVQAMLRGISAVGAGLILATGIKMAMGLRQRAFSLPWAALVFAAIALWRLPMLWVVVVTAPLGVLLVRRLVRKP